MEGQLHTPCRRMWPACMVMYCTPCMHGARAAACIAHSGGEICLATVLPWHDAKLCIIAQCRGAALMTGMRMPPATATAASLNFLPCCCCWCCYCRSDGADLLQRKMNHSLEFVWRGSEAYSTETDMFVSQYPTGTHFTVNSSRSAPKSCWLVAAAA
jgi:hypothetical protein